MGLIQKIVVSVLSVAALGGAGYFAWDYWQDRYNDHLTNPNNIIADYQRLLDEAEALQTTIGDDCKDNKGAAQTIQALENKLADLKQRRQKWLDSVPPLPEFDPELSGVDDPRGRPGSEVPELSSEVPPLPDISPDLIETPPGRPGSEIPELSSDVPPLPDVKIGLIDGDDSEYVPEMPELNTGRPGSEVPELSSDVPPLPEIDEADIIDPNELIYQMDEYERKISEVLTKLKGMCEDEEGQKVKPKVSSDKCSDACQRYKDCAAYTEGVTSADLKDAYDTCMEECVTWPKQAVKCINATNIKAPNDCISLVQCQLPQFYEEKYLK